MAGVYVRLLAAKSIPDASGNLVRYAPGDWVEVGKHIARQWVARGEATIPDIQRAKNAVAGSLTDACVVYQGNLPKNDLARFGLTFQHGAFTLPKPRTFLWNTSYDCSDLAIVAGFGRLEKTKFLDRWEAAAILTNTKTDLSKIKDSHSQAMVLALIGDTKLPVYNTEAVWLYKTPASIEFVKLWKKYVEESIEIHYAFTMALYQSRIMLCTLPPGWFSLCPR